MPLIITNVWQGTRSVNADFIELARTLLQAHTLAATAGATSPDAQVAVVRVLAPLVEPAMALLQAARAAWRQNLWQLEPVVPRIWKM